MPDQGAPVAGGVLAFRGLEALVGAAVQNPVRVVGSVLNHTHLNGWLHIHSRQLRPCDLCHRSLLCHGRSRVMDVPAAREEHRDTLRDVAALRGGVLHAPASSRQALLFFFLTCARPIVGLARAPAVWNCVGSSDCARVTVPRPVPTTTQHSRCHIVIGCGHAR